MRLFWCLLLLSVLLECGIAQQPNNVKKQSKRQETFKQHTENARAQQKEKESEANPYGSIADHSKELEDLEVEEGTFKELLNLFGQVAGLDGVQVHIQTLDDEKYRKQLEEKNAPVHYLVKAAWDGNLARVKALMEKQSPSERDPKTKLNAWDAAVRRGHIAILNHFLSVFPDIKDKFSNPNPINEAISQGRQDVVKWLYDHGIGVNEPGVNGFTPLHAAAQFDQIAIMQWLLNKGANGNLRTGDGYTPLLVAINYNSMRVAMWLVSSKLGNIHDVANHGVTAMMLAAARNNIEMMEWIYSINGGKIEEYTTQNQSPLHMAALEGNYAAAKWLMEKGAFLHVQSIHGNTPLDAAVEGGHHRLVKLFIEKGVPVNYWTIHVSTQRQHMSDRHLALHQWLTIYRESRSVLL